MIENINIWKPEFYDNTVNYVTSYGEELIKKLNLSNSSTIIDLGCGTGHLTNLLNEIGYKAIGIDSSIDMILKAKELYPNIEFIHGSGENFSYTDKVDFVFSNAALHWMKNADKVIKCVNNALKKDGIFFAEFGGYGNVSIIIDSIYKALESKGHNIEGIENPWYFPKLSEYTSLLENNGFIVNYASYYKRPTPLTDCPDGVGDWIRNFASSFLHNLNDYEKEDVISLAKELCRESLFINNIWYADYIRLQIHCYKS